MRFVNGFSTASYRIVNCSRKLSTGCQPPNFPQIAKVSASEYWLNPGRNATLRVRSFLCRAIALPPWEGRRKSRDPPSPPLLG